MDIWKDEVKKAVVVGEREFGPLDAHQTIRHNLVRRCEEILAEELQPGCFEQRPNMWTESQQW